MESTILEVALSQGIWAVMAIFLLIYVMKENEKRDQRQADRETEYQKVIEQLTEKFQVLLDVEKEILDIKEYIVEANQKSN